MSSKGNPFAIFSINDFLAILVSPKEIENQLVYFQNLLISVLESH